MINLQADIKKNVFGANLFYSGAPELIPGLNSGVRVSRFCVVFCRSLFVYLTFRLTIVLSGLLLMDSYYPFGFFKLFIFQKHA